MVHPARHRGFTLTELLIVIGIMAALMAISVGAFVRGSRVNKLAAAESMLAGLIRQARHTARTTGRTAMLELTQEDQGGGIYRVRVQGVTRTALWSACEGWAKPADNDDLTRPGRTGYALAAWGGLGAGKAGAFDKDKDGNSATDDPEFTEQRVATVLGPATTPFEGTLLEREKRLARGRDSDPPALLISFWVLVPAIQAVTNRPGIPDVDVIPLVQVAVDDEPADPVSVASSDTHTNGVFGDIDRSKLGLILVRSSLDQTKDDVAKARGNAKQKPAVFPSWEILGWVNADDQTRHEVSSVADLPADQDPSRGGDHPRDELAISSPEMLITQGTDVIRTVAPQGQDIAGPYSGGRWTHLALLFDRNSLVLYRDGRRIGWKKLDSVPKLYPGPGRSSEHERVIIGYAKIAGYPAGADAGKSRMPPEGTLIDDVVIERIGSDSVASLPAGVGLADAGAAVILGSDRVRISCHPDGRVEVRRASAPDVEMGTFTVFSGTDTAPEDVATVQVSNSGTLTCTLQPKVQP